MEPSRFEERDKLAAVLRAIIRDIDGSETDRAMRCADYCMKLLAASEAALAEAKLAYGKLFNEHAVTLGERDQARSDLIAATADIAWRDELAAAHPRQARIGEGVRST